MFTVKSTRVYTCVGWVTSVNTKAAVPPPSTDRFDDRVPLFLIQIGNNNPRPFLGKQQRAGFPETRRTTLRKLSLCVANSNFRSAALLRKSSNRVSGVSR